MVADWLQAELLLILPVALEACPPSSCLQILMPASGNDVGDA